MHREQFSRPRKKGRGGKIFEGLGAVVSANDRDQYEDKEREDIEMGSATEENEANYLDEANVVPDDCSTLVSFITPHAKLVESLLPGNCAADVRPAVERLLLGAIRQL